MLAKWYSRSWWAKASWHLSYRWGKPPKETSLRKLDPAGDRTRARCVTDAHAVACSTAVDQNLEYTAVMPKVSEGGVDGFSSFTFCVLQSSLPLSKTLLFIAMVASWCVSYDNRHRIACLLPSLTTLLYYFVFILRVTATADLSDDGRLLVGEYTLTTSSSPKRQVWASLIYTVNRWQYLRTLRNMWWL